MPNIKIRIEVEVDGRALSGFPLTRRLEVDETQAFGYEKSSAAGYAAIPADQLDVIKALILGTDQTITVRLDGQSDAGIVLNPGGLLIVLDAMIDAGAGASNAKLENTSGNTVNVKGIAGGT